jgi:ATPase subunit of ABC transporter with duplicated ATPase domains
LTAAARPSQFSYLKATDLSLAFHAEPLFDGVSLTVSVGDRVALVGPNGVGKSTLLKILPGQTPATDGRVAISHDGYVAEEVGFKTHWRVEDGRLSPE